ncbi:hypothetical protein SUGI_1014120 [Cryptomeria japonica]|uniref:uncharacterized protein LOC131040435 isoform X2 n=1 Tax=Cryptomeria japonica TaxID=3369 RepID=UPI0024147BE9|nr:uncharacterized protein LOC131040435 isoform X2 [Cryptomeria japonica]GLJ48020.1 hypothetical protein SUGI_1014120 [Cryptomeria japonica]
MEKNQESGKEEFVDKPIAENKSLYSIAKVEEDVNLNDKDLFKLESKLNRLICEDDSLEFVSLFKCIRKASVSELITGTDGNAKSKDDEDKMSRLLQKLLQLACKLDSVACARAIIEGEIGPSLPVNTLDENGKTALHHAAQSHSHNCINLLLRNQARTDIKSKEGQSPLDMALLSKRMQVDWSLTSGTAELLSLIGDKDIAAVRILAVNTKDIHQIAYKKAVDGHIVSFAILVIAATDLILSTLMQSDNQPQTIFESLVKNAVSLWHIEARNSDNNNSDDSDKGSTNSITLSNIQQQRKVLLSEIELLLHFRESVIKPIRDTKRLTTNALFLPLVRASQTGDEALVKLLLNGNVDPSEADSDGNTALHWGLKATASNQDTRLISLLLSHGASVSARNRLGLTAVHVAANYGHLQGLQMLLIQDAEAVDMVTETKETPLFYAVKNNHFECAMLLLGYGANRQALNLRKQRPVDVAKTQDMREMLNSQSVFEFGKLEEYLMAPASLEITSEKCFDNSAKPLLIKAGSGNQDREQHEDSSKLSLYTKTEICRYHESPSGCVRGDKCYFAHGEGELRRVKMFRSTSQRSPEDLNKKVFIGGLSPSVESEDLRDIFESKFGPVIDAVVIGSQGGEHLHSRGFGFVTFKHQESVATAVQAHYIPIFGKMVEIKGAVPKSMLELMKGTNIQEDEMHKNDREFDARKQSISSSSSSATSLDRDHLSGDVQERRDSAHTITPFLLPTPVESLAWVEKFKRWLPVFLGEVSKRLKGGEWYPLSSLKGDFRATCGLELDHVSLGYIKLSDFIRSIPGLCRMKIVPVGMGPATHMVILPSLSVPKPEYHPRHQQTIGSGKNSFVDKGRTYADAAGQIPQGTSISICTPLQASQLITTPEAETRSNANISHSGPLLYHQSTCTGKFPIRTKEDVRYLTNLLSDFNVNADGTVLTSANPNTLVNTYTVNQPAAAINSFAQATESTKSPVCYNIMDIPRSNIQLAAPNQYNPPSSSESGQGHGHPLSFLQQGGTSFFTPWTQQKPEAQFWTSTFSPKLWEKSPHSVLSPYSPAYSSPSEMAESSISKGNCRVCKDKKAIWIAVPCAHRTLCTDCRNNLKLSQRPLNCFICSHPVDEFIAMY